MEKVEVTMPAQGRADAEAPSAMNADGEDDCYGLIDCFFLGLFLIPLFDLVYV